MTANPDWGGLRLRLNNGQGTFTAPATGGFIGNVGSEPTCVAMGDVDGDGDLDLVTANYDGRSVSILL